MFKWLLRNRKDLFDLFYQRLFTASCKICGEEHYNKHEYNFIMSICLCTFRLQTNIVGMSQNNYYKIP